MLEVAEKWEREKKSKEKQAQKNNNIAKKKWFKKTHERYVENGASFNNARLGRKKMKSNTGYSEPVDFIPKSLRKKYKLGEYNTDVYKKETDSNKKKQLEKSKTKAP